MDYFGNISLGTGDTTLTNNFLTKDEADAAFFALNEGNEIKHQQWNHTSDRKFNLLPLARLKIAMADTSANGLVPYYRFLVNSQEQYSVFSFETSKTVKALKDKLIEKTGIPFNHATVLLYRNEHDYIGFHKDKISDLSQNFPIASISLGHNRLYILRDTIHNPTVSQELKLEHGSLLMLGPETNKHFNHSIPIETTNSVRIGPRISVTFRVVTTFKNIHTNELVEDGKNMQ